jgi:hypothetical protein
VVTWHPDIDVVAAMPWGIADMLFDASGGACSIPTATCH